MADALSVFEKFFRAEILAVPEAVGCFGGRLYNTFPHSRAAKPFGVFQAVPLVGVSGQALAPLIYRYLADFRIITAVPVPDTVDEALEAVKDHFAESISYTSDDFRINIRFENYIHFPVNTKFADDKLLTRGASFRAWLTR